VFWLSYFAWQRGEGEEKRDNLFEQFCPKGLKDVEKEKYRALWHSVHETLMQQFVQKFDHYFQKWLESPAAKAYASDVATQKYFRFSSDFSDYSRRRKIVIPPVKFESFTQHKGLDGVIQPGVVEWGLATVYDIFRPLARVSDVATVKVAELVVWANS
jgi:hypothetical protein